MDGSLTDALWFDFVQVKDGAVVGAFQKRPMSELETIADGMELPLLANENVQFILVYGMNESAGNAFMEKTFSADVAILAEQYTKEETAWQRSVRQGCGRIRVHVDHRRRRSLRRSFRTGQKIGE